jgi:hypothetical protein
LYIGIRTKLYRIGYKCQLFVMDLRYYKLYRLRMINQFYIPRDIYDFGLVDSCLKRLDNLKVHTVQSYHVTLLYYIINTQLSLSFLQHLLKKSITNILNDFVEAEDEEGMASPKRVSNGTLTSFVSPQRNWAFFLFNQQALEKGYSVIFMFI